MTVPRRLPAIPKKYVKVVLMAMILMGVLVTGVFAQRLYRDHQAALDQNAALVLQKSELAQQLALAAASLASVSGELEALQSEDQVVKNKALEQEIRGIQTSYQQAVTAYEAILDLRGLGAKTQPLEDNLGQVLSLLAKRQLDEATTAQQKLSVAIQTLQTQLAAVEPIPANVPASNTAPSSGSSKQVVDTDVGQFVVDLIAGDLNSTRVQVETASEGTCSDNCPVSSLADFVARSRGYAGINGPYFCPASYPSCAGKTNSFDTLIMNKHKVFFNSDNNVYSVVPALVFSGNSARIMRSSEVSRDDGADSVIAAQPALVWGGEVAFGGDGDPKKGSRGARSFIAVKDSTVYIGVVRGATVAEAARVLKALGMQHALNLDSGGSTALMVNGKYLAGPGRQTPLGIVLVRK